MEKHVLVIPGDGTGQETVPEGVKVLNALAKKRGYNITYDVALMGGEAFDHATENFPKRVLDDIPNWSDEEKRQLGMPQETIDKMYKAQEKKGSILFGAVGRKDLPKRVVELGLLHMRKLFDAVNNRPLIIDPILANQSILYRKPVTIDRLTILGYEESLYNGESGFIPKCDNPGHFTRKLFTKSKLEKFVQEAFRQAEETGQQVICASKYNVLISEELLSNIFEEVSKEYKGKVKLNTNWDEKGQLIIDNAGMQLAKSPEKFSNTLVISDAMFGDFLQSIVDVITTESATDATLERLREDGIKRIIARDLCGGLYFGERAKTHDFWFDTMHYDRLTIRNLVDVAKRYGSRIGIHAVDAVTIDEIPTFRFVRDEIDLYRQEHGYMGRTLSNKEFVKTLLTEPYSLRTLLTTNMVGDINTDLAAAISGSLGLPPSSETNSDGFGNYQPISGSAPDIAGKPLFPDAPKRGTRCNPIGQIRAVGMMVEDWGDDTGAKMIDEAVVKVLGYARTKDIHEPGYNLVTTQEMGNLIAQEIMRM